MFIAKLVLTGVDDSIFKINSALKRLYGKGPSTRIDDISVLRKRHSFYREYLSKRRENVVELIEFCSSEDDTKGLLNLRKAGNEEHFITFLDVCLIHYIESSEWRYRCYAQPVSELFTTSDEAMAMVFLENYLNDFKKMASDGQKIDRKDLRPKYTKTTSDNTKFHGWHVSGIKRYNQFQKFLKEERNTEDSKNLEIKIINYYRDFCNKQIRDSANNDSDDDLRVLDDDESFADAIDEWAEV